MNFDLALFEQFIFLIGQITLVVVIGSFLCALLLVALSIYSIGRGKLYFPRFLKAGMVLLEGLSKALFRLFGLEDSEVLTFFINLHNSMNKKAFSEVPVEERAVFLPQCLRSARCPAHLSPEGLKCRSCGQCTVGWWRIVLEKMGYRVFVVPGSSFIKRMVKKYHPKAILGVGCLNEVKEGLEMSDKIGLVSMGVVTLKEGCVETLVNWDDILETALLGIDPARIPGELADRPNGTSYTPTE